METIITLEQYEKAYENFSQRALDYSDSPIVNFTTHGFIEFHENYKHEILRDAKGSLLQKFWKKEEIGSGKIIEAVSRAMNSNVIYSGRQIQNNLIDWRKKDKFSSLISKDIERNLFDFFKNKIKDQEAFENLISLKLPYQTLAYIFFLKDSSRYMPISQVKFDSIFEMLGINFKTSHNLSWENYSNYNSIVKQFATFLKTRHREVKLLDAHSLLWWAIDDNDKEVEKSENESSESKTKSDNFQNNEGRVDYYIPEELEKESIDEEDLYESEGIDFVERLRKNIEIGTLAEQYVIQHEIDFLVNNGKPELAKRVRDVSLNYKLGFDILSFELNSEQKQIEVKSISLSGSKKSFYLSNNELLKSQKLSNYYLYAVIGIQTDSRELLIVKNPNFLEQKLFKVLPQNFKVTFK